MQKIMRSINCTQLASMRNLRRPLLCRFYSRQENKEIIRDDLHGLYKKLRWYQVFGMSKFASKKDLLRLIDLPNVKIEVDMLLDMNYLPSGKWIIGLHDAKSNDSLKNAFTKLKNSSKRFFDIQACPVNYVFQFKLASSYNIVNSNTLLVRNIPNVVNKEALLYFFDDYKLLPQNIRVLDNTLRSNFEDTKYSVLVTFPSKDEALRAMREKNLNSIDGSIVQMFLYMME